MLKQVDTINQVVESLADSVQEFVGVFCQQKIVKRANKNDDLPFCTTDQANIDALVAQYANAEAAKAAGYAKSAATRKGTSYKRETTAKTNRHRTFEEQIQDAAERWTSVLEAGKIYLKQTPEFKLAVKTCLTQGRPLEIALAIHKIAIDDGRYPGDCMGVGMNYEKIYKQVRAQNQE